MEIINANDGLLTNIEVLQILEQRKELDKYFIQHKLYPHKNNIVMDQTIDYINSTTTIESMKNITNLKKYLRNIKKICGTDVNSISTLTEGELIQIANHIPTQPVEVHLVNIYFLISFILIISI